MSISVTCPSCLTRFNVSEKFAGKSGPCPKCQKTIKIPEKSEEVVIHAPEDSSPKDSKGKSVLKPLRRQEVKVSMPVMLAAGLSTLVVFGLAFGVGLSGQEPATWMLASGAFVLAFPLVVFGYWFLHDDELQGFTGKQLITRSTICATAFALSWGLYAFIPAYVSSHTSMSEISGLEMAIFIPLMLVIGTFISVAAMELETLQGLMHYMLYFAITFALAWLSGTQLSAPLSRSAPPASVAPAVPGKPPTPAVPAEQPAEPAKKIPNLLQ